MNNYSILGYQEMEELAAYSQKILVALPNTYTVFQ